MPDDRYENEADRIIAAKRQEERDILKNRKIMYSQVFKKDEPATRKILSDLAKFCRANKTTYDDNERKQHMLEGRREVFLRIINHLNLTHEELWDLQTRGSLK